MIRAIAAAGLAFLLWPAAGSAQPMQSPEAFLLGRISGGATLERYLKAMRSEFARIDADADGKIDAADEAAHKAISATSFRTSMAMQTMYADLNGDGVVTADELRHKLLYDRRMMSSYTMQRGAAALSSSARVEQDVARLMGADTNKDGRVTWQEAIDFAKKQPGYDRINAYGLGTTTSQALALAPAGKTALTLAELEAAATAFFKSVDTDSNGTISLDELDVARRRINRAYGKSIRHHMQQQARVVCDLPKVSAAAKVVLLSAYETEALSSVALGPQDEVTGVGSINVQPGKEPLYIVIVSFRPTIWRFYGATERIERAVVTTASTFTDKSDHKRHYAAGVTGLPAERVSFPKQVGCLRYFSDAPSIASAQAAGAVKADIGKMPDVVAAKYKLSTFIVPSGKIEAINNNRPQLLVIQKSGGTLTINGDASKIQVVTPSGNIERELRRYHPGGVITVDAKKVVANVTAEPYAVLPEEAGLAQLVQSGALTQNDLGEFLINKKITFPAGLNGAHGVKFLLRRGVPKPDGSPGHSTVIAEETGEPVNLR